MIIDTSAVIAILEQEPDAQRFADAIGASAARLMSAASALEAALVVTARRGAAGARDLNRLVERAQIEIVPFTADHVRAAREGFSRFGKGRHPAGLNFGDCFSYGLAKVSGYPLLFKGDDFGKTDVEAALLPPAKRAER